MRSPALEIAILFAAMAVGTLALSYLSHVPPMGDYVAIGIGALFLVTAVVRAQREPGGPARYGIELGGLLASSEEEELGLIATIRRGFLPALREIGFAFLVAAIVFPPFAIGFYVYNAPSAPFRLVVPSGFGETALTQLIVIALPEEALFRGYFQTRFGDVFAARTKILGTEVCVPAILAASALFAIIHVVSVPHPARLAVFFPGLLFGWMRAKRGGIGAAIVFHALCNLYSEVLYASFSLG